MATPNVGPCSDTSDQVTLSVPFAAADSFRAEVLHNLKNASCNLVEGAKWFLEESDRNRLDQEDRPRLKTAERLFDSIRDQRGDLVITADGDLLASLVRMAVTDVAEDLARQLDVEASTTEDIRALLRPLSAWCDAIDRHPWLAERLTPTAVEEAGR